ncbi:MAG: alanine--glyoxylate aminotransferase family protein [Deltaproteobacteria bacterium]|nr:alanine--glyoxylate aminotransferase family protein [Deltaproteobacteria bacterium]
MIKKKLFTPGPCEIPPSVFKAMSTIEHHRTSQFKKNILEIQKGLQYLFQTGQPVLTLSSSGTGAMEAAITNTFSPQDLVLVIDGGKFGERWGEISRCFGLEVITLQIPWGKAVEPSQIENIFEKHPTIKGVLIQACETSTGVAHPIEEIARFIKEKPNTLMVVDAISALLTMPLPMDEWGLDIVVAGSQKGLMLPPGLSFIALSQKASRFEAQSKLPRFYFDLKKEKQSLEESTTSYTTPVTLMLGLKEALRLICQKGLETIFETYNLYSRVVRTTIEAWGLKVFAEPGAPGMTAVCAPRNVSGTHIVKKLKENFDITIAAGQEDYKDKIFRLSYMGYIEPEDVFYLLESLQKVLLELKVPIHTKGVLEKAKSQLKL